MDAFYGEIRAFGFTFPPIDWMYCNGATLMIQQNPVLYSIIGTMYGGDGKTTFKIPNIQSVVLMGQGTNPLSGSTYVCGDTGGENSVTLSNSQMPPHNHTINGYSLGTNTQYTSAPTTSSLLTNLVEVTNLTPPNKGGLLYAPSTTTPTATLNSGTLSPYAGTDGAHSNLQPYLVFNYCICVNGIYPSRP